MTIDKAIKILTNLGNTNPKADTRNYKQALKLGIEALKRVQEHRHYNVASSAIKLPGETKE